MNLVRIDWRAGNRSGETDCLSLMGDRACNKTVGARSVTHSVNELEINSIRHYSQSVAVLFQRRWTDTRDFEQLIK